MADWYRKTTWTPEDERDFRERLKRSRRRGEHLRLQAFELLTHGLPEPALRLLDELLVREPDSLFLTLIHESRAHALIDLGDTEAALHSFRLALAAQRERPNVMSYAALGFAELVLALRRSDLFAEALATLDELHDRGPFPAIHYRESAVRALIADDQGDVAAARRHARAALDAAATAKAPFTRHPSIGLVKAVDPQAHARLQSLGAA